MTKQVWPPATKQAPIRRKDGTITGYITLYWAPNLNCYVSIPDREEA